MLNAKSKIKELLLDKYTYLGLALVSYMGIELINSFVFRMNYFMTVENHTLISSIIPLLFLIPFFILGDREDFKRLKPFAIFFAILLTMITVSYVIYPQYDYWYFEYSRGLKLILRPDSGIYLLLFLSLFKKDEFDIMLKYLTLGMWVLFGYNLMKFGAAQYRGYWLQVSSQGREWQSSYNLIYGYTMSFLFMFFDTKNIKISDKKWKFIYYLTSVFCLVTLITDGSRGAILLVCAYLFFSLSVFLRDIFLKRKESHEWKIEKKAVITFLLKAIGFLIVLFLVIKMRNQSIDMTAVEEAEPSRNLSMLTQGDFFDSSGRSGLYKLIIDALKRHPIIGLGILGDRPLISQKLVYGYTHNVVLEFLVNFGVILGTVLLILYIIMSFRMIFVEKNKEISGLYIIFFTSSLELFLSSSFWILMYPWATLAIYFCYSNIWLEDKKRITALLRNPWAKILQKALAVIGIVFLFINGIKFVKYQKEYNTEIVSFDEPTIMLTFNAISNRDIDLYKKIDELGIKGTVFVQSDYLGEKDTDLDSLRELANNGWNVESSLVGNFELTELTESDIQMMIKQSDKVFVDSGLDKPMAYGHLYRYISEYEREILSNYYDVIVLQNLPDRVEKYSYDSLTKSDMLRLYSLYFRPSFIGKDYQEVFNEQFEMTKDENGFLVLRYHTINVSDDKKWFDDYELVKTLVKLKEQGFQFITTEDLYQESIDR